MSGREIFEGLGNYRLLHEIYGHMFDWAERMAPRSVKRMIGVSHQGRELWAVGLGDPSKPAAMYASGMHGMEYIGVEQALAVMDWFADPGRESRVRAILEGASVWFVPVCNPDGYARAAAQLRRYGVSFSRNNAGGVDLNRNWPVAWDRKSLNPLAASNHEISPYYHGPRPLSEPETRALAGFVEAMPIRTSICFHSFGDFLGYPPCYTSQPCDDTELMDAVARAVAARQPRPYRVAQEYFYVPTSGDFDDWLYFDAGVIPFLMEVGPLQLSLRRPLAFMNPFALANPVDIGRAVANNTEAVVYLAEWTAGLTDPLAEQERRIFECAG